MEDNFVDIKINPSKQNFMSNYSRFKSWLFHQVHGKNLVYNTCWEDPRCDRKLLNLDEESEVVMITSAGCNALDYLLDDPAKVYCIDINNRQNALLELKLALFKKTDHDTLFQFFGKGKMKNAKLLYEGQLRFFLSKYAQNFWDRKLYYFSESGLRKSFYYHGTAGCLAFFAKIYFRFRKNLLIQIKGLMAATSLPQQAVRYAQLESRLLTPFVGWVLNQHLVMSMVGVPQSQQALFVEKYDKGVMGYIEACFSQIFTKISIKDNYFWKVYIDGFYTQDCCPEYLKLTNFDKIKKRVERVKIRTTAISQFLTHNPGKYSHFVLLDHQDWLASNDVEELEREWRLILENSKKGAKILMRSAAETIDFFPDFVRSKIDFQKKEILDIHKQDRVGTYASVYLGSVK